MKIQRKRLADICSFKTGKLDSNAAEPDGIFPFFTCAQETYWINKHAFDTEAVLLGGNNANGVFPLKYYEGQFNAYQRTYIIETLDDEVLNTRYLYYSLRPALAHFQAASIGAATQYLTKSILDNFVISVPDIIIQNKIASILSAYDNLIENNRRRIQLLEESARLLYREWFVDLRFPGHEHVKVKDGVPEGWERKTLGEITEIVDYGYTASANEEIIGPKFLRITDIVPSIIDWKSVPYCEIDEQRLEKFRLKCGDVVVARTGATVGYAKRIGSISEDVVFASYLIRFRFTSEIDDMIMGIYMESDDYKAYVLSNAGGAAQPNANAQILSAATVFIPNKMIQDEFRAIVEPLFEQKELLQKQNSSLTEARDLLLPRLMNGEIEV